MASPERSSTRRSSTQERAVTVYRALRDRAPERARDRIADEVEGDGEQSDERRRHEDDPGIERQALAVLADDERPVGLARLQAQAEEVDGGDEDDRVGEAQADVGRDRRDDVRQDLSSQNRECSLAARDCGLDESAHGLLERRRADDARDERRLDGRDPGNEHGLARSRPGDNHQDEEKGGDRDEDVDAAHQDRVRERAAVPGDETDETAGGIGDQRGQTGEGEHAAPAPEHAREHVSADDVRAERRLRARAGKRNPDRLGRRVRGKERPEQGDAEHEDEQGEPDCPGGDPQEPHAVEHRGRHRVVLSFGTSSTTSRSAIRLMRR